MDVHNATNGLIQYLEASALEKQPDLAEKFDLITIAMTLHHIPNYKTVLENAISYIKKGGFLFIREHDAFENNFKLLLDIHD